MVMIVTDIQKIQRAEVPNKPEAVSQSGVQSSSIPMCLLGGGTRIWSVNLYQSGIMALNNVSLVPYSRGLYVQKREGEKDLVRAPGGPQELLPPTNSTANGWSHPPWSLGRFLGFQMLDHAGFARCVR